MINVCIVEDELEQANLLKSYIEKYSANNNEQFSIHYLPDGVDIAIIVTGIFWVIFLVLVMVLRRKSVKTVVEEENN